jgi:hypothetical protein
MQYPAVRMGIRRLAKRLETDKPFAKKVKRVEKMLFVKDVIPIGAGSGRYKRVDLGLTCWRRLSHNGADYHE